MQTELVLIFLCHKHAFPVLRDKEGAMHDSSNLLLKQVLVFKVTALEGLCV